MKKVFAVLFRHLIEFYKNYFTCNVCISYLSVLNIKCNCFLFVFVFLAGLEIVKIFASDGIFLWIYIMSIIDNFKTEYFSMELLRIVKPGLNIETGLVLLYYMLMIFQIFIIFMLGACLCGFFQCLIYRIDKKINLFIPRSFCEFCGQTIRFIDAVPFLNYLLLKGNCRCCKNKLPEKYFISETISGVVLVILFLLSPVSIFFNISIAIVFIFIIAFVFYLKK
jgi:hypothetical protein